MYRVYDVNVAVGGPIVKDKLWYYMSVRVQGSASEHAERLLQQERGQRERVDLRAGSSASRRSPIARGRTTRRASPGRSSPRNKITGSWDEQPVCRKCTGTTSLTGSPNFVFPTSPEADGHGEFSPQRVQQARWTSPLTNRLLLEAGFGTTYYQWGGKQLEPNPTANLVQVVNLTQAITPTVTSRRCATARRTG